MANDGEVVQKSFVDADNVEVVGIRAAGSIIARLTVDCVVVV